MRPRKNQHETDALSTFRLKKVITIKELSGVLQCSFSTTRRRLSEWKALTSYNKGGSYYTLPDIPEFSKRGLWHHKGVFFSKHGTLKNTIFHFVRTSEKGLSNSEIEKILGVNPNSFFPQYRELAELKRERYKREVVYFSSEEQMYKLQKERRFPGKPSAPKLLPDAITIEVLVELIRNPGISIEELLYRVSKKGYEIAASTVGSLLDYHNIPKKN
mgnify:CR=1 FL=1